MGMNQASVLIVEDESIVALDIQTTLRGLGYQVVGIAMSGAEALRFVEELRPDLVLMDIGLSGAVDGIHTAQQIRLLFDIPIIFLSAFTDEATLQRARQAEPFGFVIKPFDEQDLHTSIEIGLYKHRMERRLRRQSRQLEMRVQELDCLYQVSRMLGKREQSSSQVYPDLIALIPPACQYPELATARLTIRDHSVSSENFSETAWQLCVPVEVAGEQVGRLEVCYTQTPPNADQVPGLFLAEESQMLTLISELIGQSIQREQGDQLQRTSDARDRAVAEDMPALVCRFLPNGTLTYVNDQYCHYFNVSKDALLGSDFFQFIPPDQRQEVREHYQCLTPEQPSITYEHQVMNASGELRWQRWTDRALFQEDGQLIEYQSVGEDITDRRLAEDTLRASEAEHRERFETMATGIMYIDTNGVVTNANPAAGRIFNTAQRELLGKKTVESSLPAIHEDGSPFPPQELPSLVALRTGLPVRDVVVGVLVPGEKDWRWLMMNAQPQFRDEESAPYQVFITFSDITPLVRAERSLTRRWEYERAMVEIAARFANRTDFDEPVQFTLRRVGELSKATWVGFYLRKPGTNTLSMVGEWVEPQHPQAPLEFREFSYELFSYSGEVLTHGEILPLNDINDLPAEAAFEKQTLLQVGLRSCLMLPLRVDNSFAGLFICGRSEPHQWVDEDYTLLGLVVEVLSGGIERQRALEAERKSRQQSDILRQAISALTSELDLEQLLNIILQHLDQLIKNDIAFILLVEEERLELKAARGMPSGGGIGPDCLAKNYPLFQSIAQQGVPLVLGDVREDNRVVCPPELGDIHGWMALPLRSRGHVQGYLVIISYKKDAFSDADVALAQAFADQGAIAIENARLYAQAHYLSITDPLTEVFNRRHFFDLARHEFGRFRRYNGALSAILLDIDQFKLVNDTYGHIAGDLALKEVVRRLRGNLRL